MANESIENLEDRYLINPLATSSLPGRYKGVEIHAEGKESLDGLLTHPQIGIMLRRYGFIPLLGQFDFSSYLQSIQGSRAKIKFTAANELRENAETAHSDMGLHRKGAIAILLIALPSRLDRPPTLIINDGIQEEEKNVFPMDWNKYAKTGAGLLIADGLVKHFRMPWKWYGKPRMEYYRKAWIPVYRRYYVIQESLSSR